MLSGLVDIKEPWRFVSVYLSALLVTAVFQVGLFWSSTARGRWRLFAALLMVPAALMYGALIGEAVMRVVRGYPLKWLATATWLIAAAAYASQFLSLARRDGSPEVLGLGGG